MAYTRTWTKFIPVGGDAASLIWQFIENVREDTEDRASTYFSGWNSSTPTDPIVALPPILGNVVGKTKYLGAGGWTPTTTTYSDTRYLPVSGADAIQKNASVANILRNYFTLPIGSILQNVKVLGNCAVGATISIKVFRSPFVGGAPPTGVQLGSTGNFTANGLWAVVGIGGSPLAHTVLTANSYFVEAAWDASGNAAILGPVEITYDTVDSTTLD